MAGENFSTWSKQVCTQCSGSGFEAMTAYDDGYPRVCRDCDGTGRILVSPDKRSGIRSNWNDER